MVHLIRTSKTTHEMCIRNNTIVAANIKILKINRSEYGTESASYGLLSPKISHSYSLIFLHSISMMAKQYMRIHYQKYVIANHSIQVSMS